MASVEERDDRVFFSVEIGVPFTQAGAFVEAMTGNDDDIILAAETAMRDRIAQVDVRHDLTVEEVELAVEEEDTAKSVLAEVAANLPRKPREQGWEGPGCVVCGGDSCKPDLCTARVVIVETRTGNYEHVEHLIDQPVTLTADGIELTVQRLVEEYAPKYNPDVIVIADERGWLPVSDWIREQDIEGSPKAGIPFVPNGVE